MGPRKNFLNLIKEFHSYSLSSHEMRHGLRLKQTVSQVGIEGWLYCKVDKRLK